MLTIPLKFLLTIIQRLQKSSRGQARRLEILMITSRGAATGHHILQQLTIHIQTARTRFLNVQVSIRNIIQLLRTVLNFILRSQRRPAFSNIHFLVAGRVVAAIHVDRLSTYIAVAQVVCATARACVNS